MAVLFAGWLLINVMFDVIVIVCVVVVIVLIVVIGVIVIAICRYV